MAELHSKIMMIVRMFFGCDHDWESFSPARGEGDDSRCKKCYLWK